MDLGPVVSPAEEHGARKKRSRFGCNTCRSRKVKCDERPNGCANCEKLHLECSGYHRPGPAARAHSGKRTYRSCNHCRLARTKCSGDRPVCATCRGNGLSCSYDEAAGDRASTVSSGGPERDHRQAASENSDDPGRYDWQGSVPSSVDEHANSPLPWLSSPKLPQPKQIRVLVTSYFQNFHPLRCFAFIHKPTFLRRLDDELASGLESNALLHIMCSLGAQFYALEHSYTVEQLPSKFILMAGAQWAKTSQRLLLENMDKISLESLMTAQLLYDYALRMANFTQAFMLSAFMARMTQALQINLEYSADVLIQSSSTALSATSRECRRRLMWSCYVTDVLCGSGVDQLTLIYERDLKIQLPSNDFSFLHERPSVTRTLDGPPLDFLPPEIVPADLDENMGMLGFFVQQIEIRRRVLKYIKHLDTAKLPWFQDSEFALLDAELRSWYDSLPANLEFTPSTIYMRKESSKLGALCLFHCAYHQTMCDLYRIGTPALYKLRSAFSFPLDKSQYKRHLQWALFKEARTLAAIVAEGERHGPRIVGDTWLPTIVYDSNRIMLFYLTQLTDSVGPGKRELVMNTIPYLQSNLRALEAMAATNAVAEGLSRAADSMLKNLGVDSNSVHPLPNIILDDPFLALMSKDRRSIPGTPKQSAPDYVLNPLSIFRMARSEIPEGHAPESTTTRSSETPVLNNPTSSSHTPRSARPLDQPQEPSDGYGSVESGFGSNLGMFFTPNLEMDWHSADMVVGSGMEGEGLLPWVGTSQLGEFTFDPQNQM